MTTREYLDKQISDAKALINKLEREKAQLPDVIVQGLSFGPYGKPELVVDLGGCNNYPDTIRVTVGEGAITKHVYVLRD